ncbi:cytochrome c biogenesis protein CcdA/thiol-disulfide isomerase/thioredoxin [Dokdonella fugitiva]|uniref:Cytochrome c biogenesis protein CcdA/thiol-disulfide isomerase/thioredoxin n=1 Tax=Dokdonella fugitiva TaxID=328517 RepID=A0A839F0Y2_9GAMM|nr:cytochrome c biogenesis protein DipZ [Dokdonella fugitiva]MBA8889725.1 cytochrome c biogenesis protein CcdA/thiol-disulfide isomerase/thioredoxin [Dokdonella fugitiva]
MTFLILAYLGGVLTILSPCILPVLPFVFARADQPFVRSGLPMLLGMALTFALVATLAAVGGAWAVHANVYGRWLALLILALFGLTLLLPRVADRLMQPLVALGARLSNRGDADAPSTLSSVVLGIGTGLLWAPCAGPILGLVLTGAALHGANIGTFGLLLAYAAGAATSLALALFVGGRVFGALKRSLGAGEWVRRGLGVAVLVAVAAIALGADTGWLTRLSLARTNGVEQSLIDAIGARSPGAAPSAPAGEGAMMAAKPHATVDGVRSEGELPPLDGAVAWLNSPPLTREGLRGKVVLVDFWTYSCVNCLRTLPYVRAWYAKYKDQGLVVIGVHAPEFAFEKDETNVRRAVADLAVDYPVALDNDYAIWRGFNNEYWPAHYFIDAQGRIRHHHFGEGAYEQSETWIRELLEEARGGMPGAMPMDAQAVQPDTSGLALAPANADVGSPETYLGYERAEHFASPGGAVHDAAHDYAVPATLPLNAWGLAGTWTVADEKARLDKPGGRVVFRFHARDLNLVLGPMADGKPARFVVRIDGARPGDDHGVDTDADGQGTVTQQKLYQLYRAKGAVNDRTFEIEFLDPVEAFAFTFG